MTAARQPAAERATRRAIADRSADDEALENERGAAARRSAQRPRPARRPDRRLPHRQQQRPARRLRQHRHRHAELLRADLRAEEHHLRRQVPHHRRQGEASRTSACASRKGYYAVNTAAGAPVLDHEARGARRRSIARRCPNAFPVRALPLRSPSLAASRPDAGAGHACRRAASRSCRPSDKKTYTSDFVVLVQLQGRPGPGAREDEPALSAAMARSSRCDAPRSARCCSTATRS